MVQGVRQLIGHVSNDLSINAFAIFDILRNTSDQLFSLGVNLAGPTRSSPLRTPSEVRHFAWPGRSSALAHFGFHVDFELFCFRTINAFFCVDVENRDAQFLIFRMVYSF